MATRRYVKRPAAKGGSEAALAKEAANINKLFEKYRDPCVPCRLPPSPPTHPTLPSLATPSRTFRRWTLTPWLLGLQEHGGPDRRGGHREALQTAEAGKWTSVFCIHQVASGVGCISLTRELLGRFPPQDPSDVRVLMLAFKMNAQRMGYFSLVRPKTPHASE